MRLLLALSFAGSSLLAAACYQSDSSGGGSEKNTDICASFCGGQAEQGCTTPSLEQCNTECETSLQSLGPCAQPWREVMQCAVNAGFTCGPEGRAVLPQGCRAQNDSYNACLQTNFDAGG